MRRTSVAVVCLAILGGAVQAAPVLTVTQGEEEDLAVLWSSSDLIQGLIATELPGDNGWHPVNEDPLDKLPALTDGAGMRSTGFTGLLNDFPTLGDPTKLIDYALPEPATIGEIRVFTGNNGRDGRVFHTYTVEFSDDNGATYSPPIYVQSHPSGTLNNVQNNQWRVVLSQLTDDSGPLAVDATNIRLYFYSVDNTGGQNRDPFDGVNPFTEVDDQLTAAFVSPLVWEIDVFPFTGEICNNGVDDDGDELVDCDDPDCAGSEFCQCNDPFADADGDGDVDQADFGAWQVCYTGVDGGVFLGCECFNHDGDGDVDQEDFGAFQLCISGPDIAADPSCDNPLVE
ncbi:MAG: hypothetical protein AMXMBFR13_36990 [Phycisphaerae bacterium]